jgi:GYF domain 2
MIWYVRRGERERGPLGEEALRALVGTGQVTPDTMLWRQGLPDWTAAGALPGVLGPGATAAPAAPRRGIITPVYWATVGICLIAAAALLAFRPQGWHERARYAAVLTPIPILQQELTQAANGVNASTPRMIDNMTRLDGAQAGPGTLFTYEYTLINIRARLLSSASLETLRQRLSADVRQTVCRGTALKPLLSIGAVIRFHYSDQDGQELALVSVSSADCAT